ncbi:Gluconate transport-inducing protein [Sorochytrium milnesiophthora]
MAESYHGYIETLEDALIIVEAARIGAIPRITRRLTDDERASVIRSGSVFVFEETESQVRRWADSRLWSSSRMKGHFLVYTELPHAVPSASSAQSGGASAAARASALLAASQESESSTSPSFPPHSSQHQHRHNGPSGSPSPPLPTSATTPTRPMLRKKALSLSSAQGSKLRLISYYTEDDVRRKVLPLPSHDPALAHISIPHNFYYAGNDVPVVVTRVGHGVPPPSSSASAAASLTSAAAQARHRSPSPTQQQQQQQQQQQRHRTYYQQQQQLAAGPHSYNINNETKPVPIHQHHVQQLHQQHYHLMQQQQQQRQGSQQTTPDELLRSGSSGFMPPTLPARPSTHLSLSPIAPQQAQQQHHSSQYHAASSSLSPSPLDTSAPSAAAASAWHPGVAPSRHPYASAIAMAAESAGADVGNDKEHDVVDDVTMQDAMGVVSLPPLAAPYSPRHSPTFSSLSHRAGLAAAAPMAGSGGPTIPAAAAPVAGAGAGAPLSGGPSPNHSARYLPSFPSPYPRRAQPPRSQSAYYSQSAPSSPLSVHALTTPTISTSSSFQQQQQQQPQRHLSSSLPASTHFATVYLDAAALLPTPATTTSATTPVSASIDVVDPTTSAIPQNPPPEQWYSWLPSEDSRQLRLLDGVLRL